MFSHVPIQPVPTPYYLSPSLLKHPLRRVTKILAKYVWPQEKMLILCQERYQARLWHISDTSIGTHILLQVPA